MKYAIAVLIATVVFLCASSQATDPRIQYSTYFGGSTLTCTNPEGYPCTQPPAPSSVAKAVAVDGTGNMYVLGTTNESDFPITTGSTTVPVWCDYSSDQQPCYPTADFLAKFSSQGRLLYSTLLPRLREGNALAVDGAGNAYVVGDGNLRSIAYRCYSAWVMKFNSSGALVYSYSPDIDADTQCFGTDSATGIALNASGTAAYVVGASNGGFGYIQTTPGAYQATLNTHGYTGPWVVKLNIASSTGASLVYGTYLGEGYPTGIATDAGGNAYLVGAAFNDYPNAYPTTANAYQKTFGGGASDAFVTKLNSTGSALVYSTVLGGSGDDSAGGVRVDSLGNVFVTGLTTSSNFPHSGGFGSGSPTSFVARLNSSATALTYSTLIRGGATAGIALDSAANVYIAGMTNSTGFPKAIPFQSTLRGPSDAFFTNLSANGATLLTSSYLGGSGNDGATAIVVDKAWNAYLVGFTSSADFPLTTNAYQSTLKGSKAVFLTKVIIEGDLALTVSPSSSPLVQHNSNLTYTFAVTNNGPDKSDGLVLTADVPFEYVSYTATNGTCTHPPLGSWGTLKCTRNGALLAGHSWGPITLTVHIPWGLIPNSAIVQRASVTAKTQDVNQANNSVQVIVRCARW